MAVVLTESTTYGTRAIAVLPTTDTDRYGMSFTVPANSKKLTKISTVLVGDITDFDKGDIVLHLYATSNGYPTGSALATATTDVYGSIDLFTEAWFDFTFSTPVDISGGTEYAIILSHAYYEMFVNDVYWQYDENEGYSDGAGFESDDSGSTWSDSSSDMTFKAYGTYGDDTLIKTTSVTDYDHGYESTLSSGIDIGTEKIQFSEANMTTVSSDNSSYVASDDDVLFAPSATDYQVFLFERFNSGTADRNIDIEWNGKSNLDCSTETTYLQIYNFNSSAWSTLDSDSTTAAGTDFTLEGSVETNQSYYYDTDESYAIRVYQKGYEEEEEPPGGGDNPPPPPL